MNWKEFLDAATGFMSILFTFVLLYFVRASFGVVEVKMKILMTGTLIALGIIAIPMLCYAAWVMYEMWRFL